MRAKAEQQIEHAIWQLTTRQRSGIEAVAGPQFRVEGDDGITPSP
jgi:hypothetical protein